MQPTFSGKNDVYLEIAERFKEYIRLGIIQEGEKLPSVRTTATELGVNPNTVARAYAVLETEGVVRTLPKKGVYVIRPDADQAAETDSKKEILRALRDAGVTREQLLLWIEEVYEDHDRDQTIDP